LAAFAGIDIISMPINYSILQALSKFHRYFGSNFTVTIPGVEDETLNLQEVVNRVSENLINIFRWDSEGRIAALPEKSPFQNNPEWSDLRLFHEYFHGETGLGL